MFCHILATGVNVVFDPIGGAHLWESRKALRCGGSVVGYGLTTSLRGEDLKSTRPGRRQRYRGTPKFALYIVGGWLLPGRKRVVPYSIQTLKRLKPAWFREDLIVLLDLLKQQKLKPLVTRRFSFAEAREAHEMLVDGGVIGKIVLVSEDRKAELDLASAAALFGPDPEITSELFLYRRPTTRNSVAARLGPNATTENQ
jgi:NADPH2:quinone reductase